MGFILLPSAAQFPGLPFSLEQGDDLRSSGAQEAHQGCSKGVDCHPLRGDGSKLLISKMSLLYKKYKLVWWHRFVIPALRSLKCYEKFEDTLGYSATVSKGKTAQSLAK